MKIKCPVCGSKLYNGECPYCKITQTQVVNASNVKAKEYIKQGKTDQVYNSRYMPKDVNVKKYALYTLFLGIVGVHDFYIGRKLRGYFHAVSTALLVLISLLHGASGYFGWGADNGLIIIMRWLAYVFVFGLMLWVNDIIKLITKKTSVPVVLAQLPNVNGKYKNKNK